MRRGWISLAIGATFLSLALTLSAALAQWAPAGTPLAVVREGLTICGWVAMWRPLQIFLYDWWPVLGEQRLYDRLQAMPNLILLDPQAPPPRPGQTPGSVHPV